MTTGDRIKTRRVRLGLSVDELAARLGKNRATVYRYENNEISNFPAKVLEPLAKALETTPAALMGLGEDLTAEPTFPLDADPIPNLVPAPRLGTIACGQPILAQQNIECYDLVPDWAGCDFTLRCKGDSMIGARIYDGDIVFIRSQEDVDDGDIAAVVLDDEATLKRVYHVKKGLQLRSENPKYAPMLFTLDECSSIRILGKAVGFQSRL